MHDPIHAQLAKEPGALRDLPARTRVKLVLRRGIMSGTIPGGTRLVQSSIAEELTAGTGTVRDALRELAAEGFVRLDGHGGAVVSELCRSELEEIYEIRMMLEPVATARAAVVASRARVLQAVEMLAAMESEADATQWAEYNSSFHRALDEAGSNARLGAILTNLRELSARYIRHSLLASPDRARQANAEHDEILRAVIAGDPEAAADAVLRHLAGTLGALRVRQIGAAPDQRCRPQSHQPQGRQPRAGAGPRGSITSGVPWQHRGEAPGSA
jgi:DNA-binding GntR family transcriptional regulator